MSGLSEEQRMMRQSCRDFVDDVVLPFIKQNWQREWSMVNTCASPVWYEAGFEVLQPPSEISADHLRCVRPSAPRGHFVNNSTGKLSTHLSSSSSVSSSGSSLCFLNHNSSSRVPSARSVLVQVASSRLGFEPAMLTISRRPRRGPSEDQSRFSSLRIRRNMLNSGLFTGKRLSLNCVILLGSFRDSHVMRRCLIRRDENGRSLR